LIEQLAPIAIAALEPVLKNILTNLPANMVALGPAAPAVDVEAAVASNLVKKMPAITAAEFTKIKAMIGTAIAIYKTDHPSDDLQSELAWIDILARASAGITAEGIVVSAIPPSTQWQMVLSGVEMYLAGLGTKALAVGK
jgi:hypothetical protein